MLKNITSRLLSQAVQDSMPDVGLVPTYQNCSVCEPPGIYHMSVYLRCLEADLHARIDLLGTHQEPACHASIAGSCQCRSTLLLSVQKSLRYHVRWACRKPYTTC